VPAKFVGDLASSECARKFHEVVSEVRVAGCPHGKSWVTCAPSRSTYGLDQHEPSVVSPSAVPNNTLHRGADCSLFGSIAGRIADIWCSRGVCRKVSVDCFNAIGTVRCCATDGSLHVYVEVVVTQFCCGVADVNCLQNTNAGDVGVIEVGASHVATMSHIIMVIRCIENGKLRSYVTGEHNAMPINASICNAEVESAMQYMQ